MGFYHNFKSKYSPSEKVIERQSKVVSELDEYGNEVKRVCYEDVDVSSADYIKDIPTVDEYTLENLIAAGVPLETLNVDGLLALNAAKQLEACENLKIKTDEYNKSEK